MPETDKHSTKPQMGVFSRLHSRFKKNRLGELLVIHGKLTPAELNQALKDSRSEGVQLGQLLVSRNIITQNTIRATLMEQFALRCTMTAVAIFISIGSMGIAKQARAGQIQDAPARISVVQASFQKAAFHPKLFGATEKRSTSLKAFDKWTGMFDRFNASLNAPNAPAEITQFRQNLQTLKGMPLNKMATAVNNMMNQKRYVTDKANYGKNDYWATPVEFMQRGGDCEDFAIAKYTALRALGVPENRLRVAIVQDLEKNIPHAVLIVYTDQGPMLLDNQIKTAVNVNKVSHYKPIFSINQEAWWLHTMPKTGLTRMASAAQ